MPEALASEFAELRAASLGVLEHTVQAERALMQPFIEGCGPWRMYFLDHVAGGTETSPTRFLECLAVAFAAHARGRVSTLSANAHTCAYHLGGARSATGY
jgi:hypothetical protein